QLGLMSLLLVLSTAVAFGQPTRDHPYAARSHPYTVTPTASQGHLPAGHHAAGASAPTQQPALPVAKTSGSSGVSATTVFGLMGLALFAGAMIAIWAAARTGHVTRERPASR
ncbi:MAG: hypothetical protein QOF68_1918, partial [Gaiellales bacterium]|nr:hypothetical protein [Gaiellales bacterium]